jgi:glucokinase
VILAGDVGGTKTVVAVYERADQGPLREARYASRDHDSLESVVERFLAEEAPEARGKLASACFGAAGPVVDGRIKTTNLPWMLTEEEIARSLGVRRAKLLNDLEAAAYGMLFLPDEQFEVLNPGRRPRGRGNLAVLAAGTGLGEGFLFWDGERHHPVGSEGSHGDFAPRDEEEIELLRWLQAEHGHASWERVLSGRGTVDLYRFLRQRSGEPEPEWLARELAAGDPAAVVSQAGLEERDPVCVRTLERFASIYGGEAGNLALQYVALGGVVVGGGIAPKILPALRSGAFMQAFLDKGRFSDLLAGIHVAVALEPKAPIIGAAHYAERLL